MTVKKQETIQLSEMLSLTNVSMLYTWLKYADDEKGSGMSDEPIGKKYIGLAYNKTTMKESTDPKDYKWSKMQGEDGKSFTIKGRYETYEELIREHPTGEEGDAYIVDTNIWAWIGGSWVDLGRIKGEDGSPGITLYTWIKYADDDHGTGMSDNPQGKKYIGIAYNKTTQKEELDYRLYTWSKIQASDFVIEGTLNSTNDLPPKGEVGHSYIINGELWTWKVDPMSGIGSWANMGQFIGGSTVMADKDPETFTWSVIQGWIGTNKTWSNIKNWNKIVKGDVLIVPVKVGDKDNCICHVYCDVTEQPKDSNIKTLVKSTQIGPQGPQGQPGLQGLQGPQGLEGIPGKNGIDGVSSYFHIKYSHKPNPTVSSDMIEVPAEYIGTYVDNIKEDSKDPKKYAWHRLEGAQGPKGEHGIPGKDGLNGKTTYLHIKYSNDGGKHFTTNNGEDTGDWLGQYTDYTQADSMEIGKYKWKKIVGEKGEQGVPGIKGENGVSSYFHIKYSHKSNPQSSSDMQETPAEYIGTYTDNIIKDSNNPRDYQWYRFQGLQGSKGENGIPGKNGINGETSYLHIKYSNDGGKNFTSSNGETVGEWLGQYVDYIKADSNNPKDYTWSKIKGDKGEQGIPGVKGESGASSYFHIKYSHKEKPLYSNDMQETPAEYIGTYVDTTREDSLDPKRYTWYRFQGLQGAKGDKGIPGGIGPDGKPAYLHIKYSNDGGKSFTGHNGEDVGKYIGVYTDNNKEDSSHPGDYTWSLIKGNGVIMAETSDRTYTWSQVEGMIGTTQQWANIYNWMSMDKGDTIIIPVKISDKKYAICHIYCEVTQRPTDNRVYAKVISAQMGPEGPQGPQGPEGPILDWVQDWDSGKTTIGGEKVLTPKIFAGKLDNIYENGVYVKKPTGVAMGERCFGTLNGFQNMAGICAYNKGIQTFSIDTSGQVYFGDPSGANGLITYKNGRLSIKAPSIELSTIGDVGTKLDGMNNLITGHSSSIKILEDGIKTKVSSTTYENGIKGVNGKIDNMQIGGRNLALKTSNQFTSWYSDFDGRDNNCPGLAKVLTDGLMIGDTITTRLEYNFENIVPVKGKKAECWYQGFGNVTSWGNGSFGGSPRHTINGSNRIIIEGSFKINAEHLKNQYWLTNIKHDGVQSGRVRWRLLKVEKGNKATDWTPAPEDTSEKIDGVSQRVTKTESSITQLSDKIETKVSSTVYESGIRDVNGKINSANGKIDGANSKIDSANKIISQHTSSISQLSNSISSKVSSTTYESGIKGVNDKIDTANRKISSAESSITQLSNSVSTKVSQTVYNNDKSSMDSKINSANNTANSANKTANSANSKVNNLESRVSTAEQKITPTSIVNSVSNGIQGGTTLNVTSTTLDKNGLTIKNGALTIKNKKGETVFNSDVNGDLLMKGQFSAGGSNGKIEMKGTNLYGYSPVNYNAPVYTSGVWHPDADPKQPLSGYVSTSITNSELSDDQGALYMSGIKGTSWDGNVRARIRYTRNQASTYSELEFSRYGNLAMVTSNSNYYREGFYLSSDGYIYPYKGNEYIGGTSLRWKYGYYQNLNTTNLFYTNYKVVALDLDAEENDAPIISPSTKDIVDYIKNTKVGVFNEDGAKRGKSNLDTMSLRPYYDDREAKNVNLVEKMINKAETNKDGTHGGECTDIVGYLGALTVALQEAMKENEQLKAENSAIKTDLTLIKQQLNIK